MKYVLALFAFMIYSPLALSAQWQENVHYTVLDAPQTDGKEVTEFFSFWCGACYRTESMLPPLKKALSEDTTFKKVHVNFMGFTTPQTQNAATQAMIIARLYKQEEAMQTALFNAIHQQRKTISGLDDIKAVFVAAGMDAADFDKGATSFAANNLVKRNNREVPRSCSV